MQPIQKETQGVAGNEIDLSRRAFTAIAAGVLLGAILPGCNESSSERRVKKSSTPELTHGLMSGDVSYDQAVIWARTNMPATMIVEWATVESFADSRIQRGPVATPESDYTAKLVLRDLPPDQQIFYRTSFDPLSGSGKSSEAVVGSFRTPPVKPSNIRFLWSGDTAGQGFGINPDIGGMRIYETMRQTKPHFFIHCGDNVYVDEPIESRVRLPDGTVWKNLTTREKSKVAETLDEFRGNYKYNLLDSNVSAFNGEVAQINLWDDHEFGDDWYPGKAIEDNRYRVRDSAVLEARGKQAFSEFTPTTPGAGDPSKLFRSFPYGPSLEIFRLDQRSYRGPNSHAGDSSESELTAFYGKAQLEWLKSALLASKATWKVIVADSPIGLIVEGEKGFDSGANSDGPVSGREFETAALLKFIKASGIKNIVWLTADVHYAAAHYYDPEKAQFTDFNSFWEFSAGPLNAGTLGPNPLDNTFGPQLKFCSVPEGMPQYQDPSKGLQFFGMVDIDGKSEVLTVSLHDSIGRKLYEVPILPVK